MTATASKIPRIALNIKRDALVGQPLLARLADDDDHTALNDAARDALATYLLLSDRAIRTLSLKEREVLLLLDVARGWRVTPENAVYLAGEVETATARGVGAERDVDVKGLLRTLRNLEPFAVAALAWTLKAAWTTAERYGGVLEAARALGLLGPDDTGRAL